MRIAFAKESRACFFVGEISRAAGMGDRPILLLDSIVPSGDEIGEGSSSRLFLCWYLSRRSPFIIWRSSRWAKTDHWLGLTFVEVRITMSRLSLLFTFNKFTIAGNDDGPAWSLFIDRKTGVGKDLKLSVRHVRLSKSRLPWFIFGMNEQLVYRSARSRCFLHVWHAWWSVVLFSIVNWFGSSSESKRIRTVIGSVDRLLVTSLTLF